MMLCYELTESEALVICGMRVFLIDVVAFLLW